MNLVHSIIRRQEGFQIVQDYDIALYRLKCYHDDVYRGITPNVNAPDFNPEPPVFACRFSSTVGYEQVLALANEDGKIALQNTAIKGNPDEPLEGTQAHCNAIFDIAWMPGELKLVTASGDHSARLWDVGGEEIKQMESFHAHTRTVKTAVFRHQDKAVFATGARDGVIMIWDIRANHSDQPKPDNCIANAHFSPSTSNTKHRRSVTKCSRAQSITGLAFQDDFTLLSCAAGDGLIKVWDLRKNYTVHKKAPLAKHVMNYCGGSSRNGFTSLLVCPAGITLYASCMDNIIYAYNISSYDTKPVAEYFGHQNSSFYVKTCLSPDGRYLASGSGDDLAYIWHTGRPGPPLVKLSGHTEEVTCTAWCSVGEVKIVTCSDDSRHRIWRVGSEHKMENEEIEVRGQAEAMSFIHLVGDARLETTPTNRRYISRKEATPGSDSTPGSGTTPGSSTNLRQESNANTCLKRTYSQMNSAYASRSENKLKSALSPIHENIEHVSKRLHYLESRARRLFSPTSDSASEPSTSSSSTNSERETPFSPTLNLPNFVIDGTAPHLLEMSPRKYKENIDWLTKIRKEKFKQSITALEALASKETQVTPARRAVRSRSTEPRKPPRSPSLSLLDFFKVTEKDCVLRTDKHSAINSTDSSSSQSR